MEEIKENEYIRTTQGTIARIEDTEFDICYNTFNQLLYKNWIMSECFYEEIVKHSSNIIDLIEIGDYVNGKLIHNKFGNPKNGELMIIYGNGKHFDNKNIKTVVTKEQFANAEYKVKE